MAFALTHFGVGNIWIEHVKTIEMVREETSQSPIQFCHFRMFSSSLIKYAHSCSYVFSVVHLTLVEK